MPANANPPEEKSSVPSLFNVQLGHWIPFRTIQSWVPGSQPPLLKNPFTILKRFLQIRTYSYGKFSLLIDSLEFDLNTLTLNYYLAFKSFGSTRGNESNPDKKQPKRYLTELNYNPSICTDYDLKVLKSYQLDQQFSYFWIYLLLLNLPNLSEGYPEIPDVRVSILYMFEHYSIKWSIMLVSNRYGTATFLYQWSS